MTVVEFLDCLADAPPGMWRLYSDGFIGTWNHPFLTCAGGYAVWMAAGRPPYHCSYCVPWSAYGLTGPGAVPWESIWDANDAKPGHNPTIRRALLAACGLEEERT